MQTKTVKQFTDDLKAGHTITMPHANADTLLAYIAEFEPDLEVSKLELINNTVITKKWKQH